jgi:hypothetical protein
MTADEIRAANQRSELSATRRFEAERNDNLREFQARADNAFNECGLGIAPRRRSGDSEVQHCAQVLDELLGAVSHLPTMGMQWKGFNPRTLGDKAAVDALAPVIFADSVKAMNATGPGTGPERCIEKRDSTGRTIRHFAGDFDPWAPFKAKTQVITAWNPKGHGKGAHATGAIVAQSVMMSDGSVRAAR